MTCLRWAARYPAGCCCGGGGGGELRDQPPAAASPPDLDSRAGRHSDTHSPNATTPRPVAGATAAGALQPATACRRAAATSPDKSNGLISSFKVRFLLDLLPNASLLQSQ